MQMLTDFESVVGLPFLRGMHLNDSKGELGCGLDRHENIGGCRSIGMSLSLLLSLLLLLSLSLSLSLSLCDYVAQSCCLLLLF